MNDAPYSFQGIRAHIVPHCLGGGESVWNILPLCDDCHRLNPEQESRRVYLDWLIYRRRFVQGVMVRLANQSAAENPGVDFGELYRTDPIEAEAIIAVVMQRYKDIIYAPNTVSV